MFAHVESFTERESFSKMRSSGISLVVPDALDVSEAIPPALGGEPRPDAIFVGTTHLPTDRAALIVAAVLLDVYYLLSIIFRLTLLLLT